MSTLDWQDASACRGDSWLFDHIVLEPSDRDATNEAKAICATCPIKLDCREHALTTAEPHGVWGGLDEHQRRAILKARVA